MDHPSSQMMQSHEGSLPSISLSKRLDRHFKEPSLTSQERRAQKDKEAAEKAWYNYGQGDKKLYADWAYFYNAYCALAAPLGLGAPTTMIGPEGSVAALFVFVHELGPRNVVQALMGNMKSEDTEFKKCVLSLLIITTTFLRQKLGLGLVIGKGFHNRKLVASDQVVEWAATALFDQIIEPGVVSLAVQLLASTAVRSVQELVLRLLSDLVRPSSSFSPAPVTAADVHALSSFPLPPTYAGAGLRGRRDRPAAAPRLLRRGSAEHGPQGR
jgi:hypothetical protein